MRQQLRECAEGYGGEVSAREKVEMLALVLIAVVYALWRPA